MQTNGTDMRGLEFEAYEQHGYFTTGQAQRHGVNNQLLNHHVKSGRFERMRRGLYHLSGFPAAEHDDVREKWMAVGMEKAIVSHDTALALLDLSDNIPNVVHLLVPRRHKSVRPPPGVEIHSRSEGHQTPTVTRDGIVVEAPAHALVDAVGTIQPDQLERAVRQALRRGLVTRSQLVQASRGSKASTLLRLLESVSE